MVEKSSEKSLDLRQLSLDELHKREGDLRKQLLEARFDKAVGRLLDLSSPKRLRRQLARVLTCSRAISLQRIGKEVKG